MLCDKCGKENATIHFTEIVNGVKSESNLCASCANSENLFTTYKEPFSFLVRTDKASGGICPSCNTRWAQFNKTGLLGCSECYNAFEELLTPIMREIHGASMQPVMDDLHAQLAAAIESEDYESAAKLRDQIREREGNA